ncbi:MAG: hypothetical protein RLY71_1374 [Pseudomonadota bacterium]|jgi:hypothetical protein
MKKIKSLPFLISCIFSISANATDVGVYYFPGWNSTNIYWNDIKGLPNSRSPNVPWPERKPLLGYYAEEDVSVAEQHIEYAANHGIKFFAYDWYWDGSKTSLNHAIENFMKSKNNQKMSFSILWANHSEIPKTIEHFDSMVEYWIKNYFNKENYYKINGSPVVFVFSINHLDISAYKLGLTTRLLLGRANKISTRFGQAEIKFIAATNRKPTTSLEETLSSAGFYAYTGWNYVAADNAPKIADYSSMVETYRKYFAAAQSTSGIIPYIPATSPGWDSRPWQGAAAFVRENATPEKFRTNLIDAKNFLVSNKKNKLDIVMIEAWNEFGEGAYIEPTTQWGTKYIEQVNDIFGTRQAK